MTAFSIPPIPALDSDARRRAQHLLDFKTKPRGSLGRLEELVVDIAAMRGSAELDVPNKAVVVMAGDHGVAKKGVSAYPQEVSAQMLYNFAAGGAAVNVLARAAGARVIAVDMGVLTPVEDPAIRAHRIAAGTADMSESPAMSETQAQDAVAYGIELARELTDQGVDLIALGEMGIGNTTAASALTAVFTGAPVAELTGPGTGIDNDTMRRKAQLIAAAIEFHGADRAKPWRALACLGGFEIAGLVGVALGAAAARVPVLLDGFITGAAALTAAAIDPAVRSYFIASHRSEEPGHRLGLRALELEPLLELSLRLGEGSGAALAFPIIDAAIKILREMATFENAGVSDSGA